jgi:hypothetical protein
MFPSVKIQNGGILKISKMAFVQKKFAVFLTKNTFFKEQLFFYYIYVLLLTFIDFLW